VKFLKLILSFAPWLAFLIIAHGTLFRLELGLLVGLALSVALGILRLNRGVILWVGLIFFVAASVAVIGFKDMGVIRFMGVLANGTLAAATWLTVITGRPFTLEYARAETDPSRWDNPIFIRTNYIMTSVWGGVFTLSALLAAAQTRQLFMGDLGYELTTYGLLLATVVFTCWYPERVKRAVTRSLPD
jgi:hypothetical protein